MADNASIARPYAKAVFELAQESNSYPGWSSTLSKLAAVSNDQDFSALLSDPRVERSQLTDLLIELSKECLPEGGANFIRLMVQNDRFGAIGQIEQLYSQLVAKAQKSVNAMVVTAIELTEQQQATLESALEQRLGLKVNLEQTIEPSLIGGAIVKAGDLVIDGSAKGRIEKLSSVLAR